MTVCTLTEAGVDAKMEALSKREAARHKKAREAEKAKADNEGGKDPFMPKQRSGGYAILIALLRANRALAKEELMAQSEPFATRRCGRKRASTTRATRA